MSKKTSSHVFYSAAEYSSSRHRLYVLELCAETTLNYRTLIHKFMMVVRTSIPLGRKYNRQPKCSPLHVIASDAKTHSQLFYISRNVIWRQLQRHSPDSYSGPLLSTQWSGWFFNVSHRFYGWDASMAMGRHPCRSCPCILNSGKTL